jgi:hypothetical protein
MTLATTGSKSALVNMPTHSGSVSECWRPDSPSVSYAVATMVEMLMQPYERYCQDGLKKGHGRVSGAPRITTNGSMGDIASIVSVMWPRHDRS